MVPADASTSRPSCTTIIAVNAEPISTTANVDRSEAAVRPGIEPESQGRDRDLVGRAKIHRVRLAMGWNRRQVESRGQEDDGQAGLNHGANPGTKANHPGWLTALIGPDQGHLVDLVFGQAVSRHQRQTVTGRAGDESERSPLVEERREGPGPLMAVPPA